MIPPWTGSITTHRADHPSGSGLSDDPPAPDAAGSLQRALSDVEHRISGLAAERSRIVAASESSNADDEHDPEGATIAYERELVASLLAAARRDRDEVLAALGRLADGVYGSCSRCGTAIADGRLVARPTAVTCIACSV